MDRDDNPTADEEQAALDEEAYRQALADGDVHTATCVRQRNAADAYASYCREMSGGGRAPYREDR